MGILDINDSFTNKINFDNFTPEYFDQYINGVKEHEQPLVSFTNEGESVIYREQL